MAFPWDVTIFIVIFVGVIVVLVRQAQKARAAESAATLPSLQENPHEAHLLKFVHDPNGVRIGETVAVEGDDFIVKDAKGFQKIPASLAQPDGAGLKLTGSYDEVAARAAGDKWREKSHKVIEYSSAELPPEDRAG